MKLLKLLPTCFLAFGLTLSISACDDGDDGDSSDTKANDSTTDNNEDETSGDGDGDGDSDDVSCSTFCVNYVELCLIPGKSTEFELNDDCVAACEAWDQAGINCRNEQVIMDACDQAGNMGSAC